MDTLNYDYTGKQQQRVNMNGSNVRDYGPVVPNDSTVLPKIGIALAVTGNAGDVAVTTPDGSNVTIPAVLLPVGQIIPLAFTKVRAAGTTATGIWAVFG